MKKTSHQLLPLLALQKNLVSADKYSLMLVIHMTQMGKL
jgi:hypothetical protein